MFQYFLYSYNYYIKTMIADKVETLTLKEKQDIKEKLSKALSNLKISINEEGKDFSVLTAMLSNGKIEILMETQSNNNDQPQISTKLLEVMGNELSKEKLDETQKDLHIIISEFKLLNYIQAHKYILLANIDQDDKRTIINHILLNNQEAKRSDYIEDNFDESFYWCDSYEESISYMKKMPLDKNYLNDTIESIKSMNQLYKRLERSSSWNVNNYLNKVIVYPCEKIRELFVKSIVRLYFHMSFIYSKEFIIVSEEEINDYNILDRKLCSKIGGIVYLETIDPLLNHSQEGFIRQFNNLMSGIEKYSQNFIFFVGCNKITSESFFKNPKSSKHFFSKFSLPIPDAKLLVMYWENKLSEINIFLNKEGKLSLEEKLLEIEREEEFISISNTEKIVNEIILNVPTSKRHIIKGPDKKITIGREFIYLNLIM